MSKARLFAYLRKNSSFVYSMLVALASSPGLAQEVLHDGSARYMRKSKYNELRDELQLPGTINVVISGGIEYLNEYFSDEVKKSVF